MRRDFGSKYQDIVIKGKVVEKGRRSAMRRIDVMPIDFESKVVLDMGCNVGGMLFAISDKIKRGYGIEGNVEAVNRALELSKKYNINNINFKCADIETGEIILGRYDVGFMLSLANWIVNWKDIVLKMKNSCDILVFEAHGRKDKQDKQIDFIHKNFRKVELLLKEAEDGNERSMFLCSK